MDKFEDKLKGKQTAEFMLTIFSIKMPVKFPCKMSLQSDGRIISAEVQPNDGVFTFNQQTTLKVNRSENLEISAYLTTGKGSSILAGNISLNAQSLASRQGQKFTSPLQKCIDSSASVDLKINHVWMSQDKTPPVQSVNNIAKSLAGGNILRTTSPNTRNNNNTKIRPSLNDNQTRSQFQGNMIRRGPSTTINKQPVRDFGFGNDAKRFSREPYARSKLNSNDDIGDPLMDDPRQTRTIGGGVAFQRRKQRDREKIASKKVAEQAQNNLKMDIMKYKMKSEEMQKTVNEKVKNIKELKDQILEFERKNIEKAFMQEQLVAKQNTIKMLQDRISNLNSQNTTLRQTITQHLKTINELKENIRFDVLKNKEEYDRKQQQLKYELNVSKNKVAELEQQLGNKSSQLMKAKKYIQDLESGAEQKIFEHDRIIQQLKKEHGALVKNLNMRNSQLELRVEELTKELNSKNSLLDKLNDRINKLENSEKNKEQVNQGLEIEKKQLSVYKVDFLALSKKHNKVQQSLREEQKNHKKNIESKNKEISQLESELVKLNKSYDSKLGVAQDKIKQLKNRTIELDNAIITCKNQEQKLLKTIEKLQRTINEQANRISTLQKQLKASENKLQSQYKMLNEKQTSSLHMESLHKIELQHTKESLESVTKQYEDLSSKYSQTKQNLEITKNERTKLENKIQLLDENINRLNEYIKEKKQQFELKQNEAKNTIQLLNSNLKKMEEQDKKKQKELNAWEIKELNLNNKIDRLQKTIEDNNAKIEKLEKVTLPKIMQEKDAIRRELEKTKQKLSESVEQNKYITSERTKLQSETNKNTKINSVLNQQKIMANSEINKLKNIINKQEKSQEKLNGELKTANEEIKKLNIKIEQLNKQSIRNKDVLSEAVTSLTAMKKSLPLPNSIGMRDSTYLSARNMATSRVVGYKSMENNMSASQTFDVRRIVETIESTSKEQQSTIMLLQQNLNHYKDTVDRLQKELATLSFSSKSMQEKMQETVDQLSDEVEAMHEKLLNNSNEYQDKIAKLETDLNKKEKDIKMHKSTIGSLKYEIESLNKKFDLMIEDSQMHETRANQKIDEITNELNFSQMNLRALENDKKNLEMKLYNTEEELTVQKQENLKRQRLLQELTEKLNILKADFDQANRIKKEQLQQLLSLKQQLQAVKQDNAKTKQMLKEEQKNNKKLQDFANDLLKQKQNIVKVELKSSSRAHELEADLLQVKNISENQESLLKQKDEQINQFKATIKNSQNQIKNLEGQLKEQRTKIIQLTNKLQEKEKKLAEKESELKQLTTQSNSLSTHLRVQLSTSKQQFEQLKRITLMESEQLNSKIFELEKHSSEQASQINSLKTQIQQKEELIFFQKQHGSLNQSNINDLKKKNSELSLVISKYEAEINELNQQLTYKEETLYEYSGKIYQLEQKVQAKEVEGDMKAEKVDIDWQCRHDQICEEYEQKIQYLQKDKQYLKDKISLMEEEKAKLLGQKQASTDNLERDLGQFKVREKQLQAQKLQKLNQKTKQIEALKLEIANLNNLLKTNKIQFRKKENEVNAKDEALKKLEMKIIDKDKVLGESTKKFELEINELKKGENSLKILKEQIRNSQWVTERQVKKITQSFIQKVINACPQAKDKLVDPIKYLETSMSTAINFKV